jgi:hypothetical protein
MIGQYLPQTNEIATIAKPEQVLDSHPHSRIYLAAGPLSSTSPAAAGGRTDGWGPADCLPLPGLTVHRAQPNLPGL